jgi:hypothetical protein
MPFLLVPRSRGHRARLEDDGSQVRSGTGLRFKSLSAYTVSYVDTSSPDFAVSITMTVSMKPTGVLLTHITHEDMEVRVTHENDGEGNGDSPDS